MSYDIPTICCCVCSWDPFGCAAFKTVSKYSKDWMSNTPFASLDVTNVSYALVNEWDLHGILYRIKRSEMFRHFSETHLDNIINKAKTSPQLQFTLYNPIYKKINEFVTTNSLVMSSEDADSTSTFKIYGSYIFQHANNLANELTEFTAYVRLNTNVRNKEFTIVVDGVRMIDMYNIEPNFMKIMKPLELKGALPTLSPEVELIDIYHRLYSPNKAPTWKLLRSHESKLWKLFVKSRDSIISRPVIKGGVEHIDVVMEWLKDQTGYVLVGDSATTLTRNRTQRYSTAVQIIAANPKHMIESLKEYMTEFVGANVRVKKYDMNLPDDFRIRKFVVSIVANKNTYYIANIFNSAFYELIPFVSIGNFKVGTPLVLLRFMFADLWFMRILRFFGMIDAQRYKKNIMSLFSNIDTMHAIWINEKIEVLPMYIGTYIDENCSKKKGELIYPYYPAKYKLEHGSFRTINNKT